MHACVAVDLVIFTVIDGSFSVLLIERGEGPYKGEWALPGGFVRQNESLDDAAMRELDEETTLNAKHVHIEQLRSYGDRARDPRGRVFSVAYVAFAPNLPSPLAGGDAARAEWLPVNTAAKLTLAFDHSVILEDGAERARAKLEYTALATAFCKSTFTIPELRAVYEAVWDTKLDPANFYRKVTKAKHFVEATEHARHGPEGRPAQLYRKGRAQLLSPPMTR
jgi:8-oxo-dGTP diphosphatase